jgi:hypothetical protein
MAELLEIENKIINLSKKELSTFRNWFYDYDNKVWDLQFENDVKSGNLDNLASMALLEYQNGEYSTL